MIRESRIPVLLLIIYFPTILAAQTSDTLNKVKDLKTKSLETGYEPWSLCYPDSPLQSQSVIDSVYGFQIQIPDGHNLNIIQKEDYKIMQYRPNKSASKSDVSMEIWVKPKDTMNLEAVFNKTLNSHDKHEIPFRIGTETIQETLTFWMETHDAKKHNHWELTFYFKHPKTKSTILIKQKSKKKSNFHQDFCLHGAFIRSLRWL